MLISLLSAASAHARPSFELVEQSARAGDVVHFRISGVDGWGVAYHLEIAGDDLVDGRSKALLTGTFTMPHLGEDARTVTVDADVWWSDTNRRVKRSLEYLGPRPPADPPATAPASTMPAAVAPATQAPQPNNSAKPAAGAPIARKVTPESRRAPRQTRKRRATETQRSVVSKDERRRHGHRGRDRHKRGTTAKQRRSKRSVRPPGPYVDGFTGPRAAAPSGDKDGSAATKPNAPGTMALTPRAGLDDGLKASVAVPAALGLAALTLAGAAVVRRRRLASRAERN